MGQQECTQRALQEMTSSLLSAQGSCLLGLCHPCEASPVMPALPLGFPGGSSQPSTAGGLAPSTAPEAGPGGPISAQTLGPRIRLLWTQRCQVRDCQEAWAGVQETPAHSTLGVGTLGCSLIFFEHLLSHMFSRLRDT